MLHAQLLKIRLVPDISEYNYCVYQGVSVTFIFSYSRDEVGLNGILRYASSGGLVVLFVIAEQMNVEYC